MAVAELKTETRTVHKTEKVLDHVTLKLTPVEAQVLRSAALNAYDEHWGDVTNGLGRHMARIAAALAFVGVPVVPGSIHQTLVFAKDAGKNLKEDYN